jgi:hypothetical protein
MPTIKTSVDAPTYKKLVRDRKAAGLPSVSALFLQRCGVLTDAGIATEIVRRAMNLATTKPSGFKFKLSDLFSTSQWDAFPKGARLRAGRMFYEKVGSARDGIRASHKSSSNHQLYVVA